MAAGGGTGSGLAHNMAVGAGSGRISMKYPSLEVLLGSCPYSHEEFELKYNEIKKRGNAPKNTLFGERELQLLQEMVLQTRYHKKSGTSVSINWTTLHTKYNKLVTRISLTETVVPPIQYFRTEQQLKDKMKEEKKKAAKKNIS
jgi:hypothetical protein